MDLLLTRCRCMFTEQGAYGTFQRIHMETIDDQLRRADEKRVKLLAQEMLNDWIRTVYDQSLRTALRIAGEIVVAIGLSELFRL